MKAGRPTKPAATRRTAILSVRTTPGFAAATRQIAAREGRSLASLVRASVHAYCTARAIPTR